MTATDDCYWATGATALAGLFPPEVMLAFYNRMQADLAAADRPLQGFGAQGPLLTRRALEVYAY